MNRYKDVYDETTKGLDITIWTRLDETFDVDIKNEHGEIIESIEGLRLFDSALNWAYGFVCGFRVA